MTAQRSYPLSGYTVLTSCAKMVGPEEEKQGRSGGGDGGGVRPGKLQQEGGPGTAGAAGLKRKRTGGLVTLSEIHGDKLTAVANENWARGTGATTAAPEKFRPKLVSLSGR